MQSYYLIGSPIAHSSSPAMMNYTFRRLGIDAVYALHEAQADEVPDAVEWLKSRGASGWNVTMPDKQAMLSLCDELSTASRIGGSVNTVKNDNGRLYGYTTDGIGFLSALGQYGIRLNGRKLTLLGSGGAASAILIQAALDGAGEIAVYCNRPSSRQHVEEIAEKLAPHSRTVIRIRSYHDPEQLRADLGGSTVLANGTNVGMAGSPHPEESLIPDSSYLHPGLFVYDIIYHPACTPLLTQARSAGCRCSNGLSMLIGQGAASFHIWTGREMPVDEISAYLSSPTPSPDLL